MFVADIVTEPNSAAIVRATIAMGHSLGIQVVAEGVETSAQADALRALGCDMAQGFFYSRPVSQERIGELIFRQCLNGG
jgi:EAL domain-containing protein (putative c-di-GMP-specific phosphodiesterase class I)